MANNQITPFQLTDQFTMDNFNQRINETNTALQNNDPRNWGLGSTVAPKVTDLNTVFSNGWYRTSDGDAVNFPTASDGQNYKYGWLFVTTGFYTRQDYYTNTIAPMHFIRYYVDGNWSTWDIENPPMILGVEYRTTERYLGKPVYVKLFDCGALPNNAEKQYNFGISNINGIVGHYAMGDGGDPLPSHNIQVSPQQNIDVNLLSVYDGGRIRVQTNYDASGGNLYVKLKYTKTTD